MKGICIHVDKVLIMVKKPMYSKVFNIL